MIIPHHMLSPETLHGVIEAFITREGTDYGIGPPGASDCRFTVSYN